MSHRETPAGSSPSRREFLKTSSTALAGATLLGAISARSYAGEQNTIKIALVGCGGRGSCAAAKALSTAGPTVLWAMADVFPDRLQPRLAYISKQLGRQVDVPGERQFLGMDGYRKAIDSLDPGSVVLLATPPAFRPIHLEYAVQKGMHVFMEKSFAVDAPGIRRVLRAGEEATKKNLKIAGGLMSRHAKCTRRGGPADPQRRHRRDRYLLGVPRAQPGGLHAQGHRHERLGPPDPKLQQLHLAQRDLPVGLADPPDGRLLLGKERLACLRPRARRTPGPHRAGPIVQPLRRRIHVPRRHADVLARAAHGRLLGLCRQHPARLEGHRPHGRRRLQSPPL